MPRARRRARGRRSSSSARPAAVVHLRIVSRSPVTGSGDDPRARRRADRRRRPLRHRRRLPPAAPSAPARASRSSRRATRSAAPGTCSAIPGSARTPTCSRSATRFRPWEEAKAIADGPSILDLRRARPRASTASTGRSASTTASCAPSGRPTRRAGRSRPSATDTGETRRAHLRLPASCAPATTATTRATRPSSRAPSASRGEIVHPQHWPEDLDYAGKRVVVIGSGATAVTLVPAMAETAAHVTMLQRSPSYVVSLPGRRPDRRARCAALLPAEARLRRSCAGRTCC